MFTLRVDDEIELRLHDTHNVEQLYTLIHQNRNFIGQWQEWPRIHQSVSDTTQYILWEREQLGEGKQFATQIYYQGVIVGSIALMIKDRAGGFGEIGYWLGEAYTGKGIVTRAARALLNLGFNTFGLHKVIIRAIKENIASVAVAERLGFAFEGYQIQQRLLYGTYYDYSIHYLLREDWQETQSPDFAYNIDHQTTLRPLMMHHARAFFETVNQHRLTLRAWVDWVDQHQSLKDTHKYIKTALKHYGGYDGLDVGIWHNGTFCGQVSFNSWNLHNYKGDLGYWLVAPFRGKGIMTKAVRAMIQYGFDVIGLHRIELLCAVENERSCAVAERLGFTHEGIMRRGERIRNHYYDANVYALLEDDWNQ